MRIYTHVRSSTIDRRCSCFSASSDRPRGDRSGLGCRLQSKPDICIAVSPLFNRSRHTRKHQDLYNEIIG